VITVAGAEADNVVGLVYVAAFIPDEGESLNEINARFPASRLGEVVRPYSFPVDGSGETAVEASIAPEDYPQRVRCRYACRRGCGGCRLAATDRGFRLRR
jgi:hypothetical protein